MEDVAAMSNDDFVRKYFIMVPTNSASGRPNNVMNVKDSNDISGDGYITPGVIFFMCATNYL